jgi:hypothetical protein
VAVYVSMDRLRVLTLNISFQSITTNFVETCERFNETLAVVCGNDLITPADWPEPLTKAKQSLIVLRLVKRFVFRACFGISYTMYAKTYTINRKFPGIKNLVLEAPLQADRQGGIQDKRPLPSISGEKIEKFSKDYSRISENTNKTLGRKTELGEFHALSWLFEGPSSDTEQKDEQPA